MAAVACSDVPKVSIVTGAFEGMSVHAMVSVYRHSFLLLVNKKYGLLEGIN